MLREHIPPEIEHEEMLQGMDKCVSSLALEYHFVAILPTLALLT
jgi:hypothetical protein